MSKYLEFKEISFKGKTKRFEVVSKTSKEDCPICLGNDIDNICSHCKNERQIPIILGRISWYPQWRQYTFLPSSETIWNRECMEDIIFFITNLMRDRKIVMTKRIESSEKR